MATKNPPEKDNEIKVIDSLLEEGKFEEALSTIEICLQKEDQPSSSHTVFLFPLYRALRGLRTKDIPNIIKNFDERIETAQTDQEKAKLKLEKGKSCMELSLLRTAEPEIQWALDFYLQDEKAWKKEIRACYNVLAGIYFKMSDYEQAIEYLKEYEKLVEQEIQKATYLGMLARVLMLQGELKLAEQTFLEALEIYTRIGTQPDLNKERKDWFDTQLCKSWIELSYLYIMERRLTEAQEFLKKAYNIIRSWSEKTSSSVYTESVYYEVSGDLAYVQDNYPLTHNCYQKVFDMVFEMMMKERTPLWEDMISQTNRFLAELLAAEERYDEALIASENGWKAAFEVNENIEKGAIYRVWGQIYSAIGEKYKARESFEGSISRLREIGAKYELGLTYLESGRSNAFEEFEREFYLKNAKGIFEKIGIEYYINSVSNELRSLSKSMVAPTKDSLFPNELYGKVKEIDEDESVAIVAFDVGGAPLEMEIELSDFGPEHSISEGARIKYIAEERDGKMVHRFEKLQKT